MALQHCIASGDILGRSWNFQLESDPITQWNSFSKFGILVSQPRNYRSPKKKENESLRFTFIYGSARAAQSDKMKSNRSRFERRRDFSFTHSTHTGRKEREELIFISCLYDSTKSMTINEAHFIQRTRHLGFINWPSGTVVVRPRERDQVGGEFSFLFFLKTKNVSISIFSSRLLAREVARPFNWIATDSRKLCGFLHDPHINFHARLFLYSRNRERGFEGLLSLPFSSPVASLFPIQENLNLSVP